jgi:hypothetical protein
MSHKHGEHFAGLHGLLDGAMAEWGVEERRYTDHLRFSQRDPAGPWGGQVDVIEHEGGVD